MTKLFSLAILFYSYFSFSQNIIPIKVISSEKCEYKTFKWTYHTSDGGEVYGNKIKRIGETIHYKDTIYDIIYSIGEYETSVFKEMKPYGIYPVSKEVKVTKVLKNNKNRNYKYLVFTSENITYECNVKPKVSQVVFYINTNGEYDLAP
jgi:hypothetical protein